MIYWCTNADPVLEAVLFTALFPAQVYKIVCDASRILLVHFPGDPERVAGHVADLDVTGCGEKLHLSHYL